MSSKQTSRVITTNFGNSKINATAFHAGIGSIVGFTSQNSSLTDATNKEIFGHTSEKKNFTENKELQKMFDLIDELELKLQTGKGLAEVATKWAAADLKMKEINLEKVEDKNELCDKIENLTKNFVASGILDLAASAVHCNFDLMTRFYQGKLRLKRLQQLGVLMQDLAKSCVEQNENNRFVKEEYPFLDEILKEMQTVSRCDVDVEDKFRIISNFCFNYGTCCYETSRYVTAKEMFEKSIFLLESLDRREAHQHPGLADPYFNLGKTFEAIQNQEAAIKAFEKSQEIKKKAVGREISNLDVNSASRITIDLRL